MEHRWGERIGVQEPVTIRHLNGDGETTGRMMDLSMSGALIHADMDVAACCAVEVLFEGEWILGWVSRIENTVIGIEWMGLSPAVVARRLGGSAWFPETAAEHAAVA